jgi:putative FmdB family regulatory protein
MPTYEYECKKCGHTFEIFQGFKADPLRLCPECGEEELRRLINGGMGIIFKGSGFYVNDKEGKEPAAAAAAAGTKPVKEEKKEGKKETGEKSAVCAACTESGSCAGDKAAV